MKHRVEAYKQWGWVTPDNKILDGYESEFDTHCSLLKQDKDLDELNHRSVYQGFVRWFTYKYADEIWLEPKTDGSEYDTSIELNLEGCSKERTKEAIRLLKNFAMFDKILEDKYYWDKQMCETCKGYGNVGESSKACSKCGGLGWIKK